MPKAMSQVNLSLLAKSINHFLEGQEPGYYPDNWRQFQTRSSRSYYVRQVVDGILGKLQLGVELHEESLREESLRMSTEKGRSEALNELLKSDFAEHLITLFGRPEKMVVTKIEDAGGQYGPYDDLVELNDELPSLSRARGTLTHEMAHVWQSRQGDMMGQIWNEHKIPAPPTERGNYALQDRTEHQAEAVACAIGLLSLTAIANYLETKGLVDFIKDVDMDVPGTILMLRVFLSHPAYQQNDLLSGQLKDWAPENKIDLTPLVPPGGWVKPVQMHWSDRANQRRMARIQGGWKEWQRAGIRGWREASVRDDLRVQQGEKSNPNLRRTIIDYYQESLNRTLGPALCITVAGLVAASQNMFGPGNNLSLGHLAFTGTSSILMGGLIEQGLVAPKIKRSTQRLKGAMERLLSLRSQGYIILGIQSISILGSIGGTPEKIVEAGIMTAATSLAVLAAKKGQIR